MSQRAAQQDVELSGCRPEPLAGYLKALGLFRIVAEQFDSTARASWRGDTFVLRTTRSRDELLALLLHDYRPAPVVTPWNGGGGFFYREDKGTGERSKPTEATRALDGIATSSCERLAVVREAIRVSRVLLNEAGLHSAPKDEAKAVLVSRLRDELSDEALAWLDACVLLAGEELRYPPLVGTGGTDGNLDFATNLHQRLADLWDFASGVPTIESPRWLAAALFGVPTPGLLDGAVGQFDPGAAGGTNQGAGFDRKSIVNPWDYVFMLEGTLVLAAAVTRRLGAQGPGQLAFPFSVRSSGVGYASSARSDEAASRHEVWLPMWAGASRLDEVRALFREGRARLGRRVAVRGTDFARAVATIGVDRGVREFVRYGFHARNGLSYFATPLGRFLVPATPQRAASRLTSDTDLDHWLDTLRRAAGDDHAPASLVRVATAVDATLLDLCRRGGPRATVEFLGALAEAETVLARAPKLRESVRPVPWLAQTWVEDLPLDTPTARLALGLATTGLRRRLVPVNTERRYLNWTPPGPETVWRGRDLVTDLTAIVRRDAIEANRSPTAATPSVACVLADVASFVRAGARTPDEVELSSMARAFSLLEPGIRCNPPGAESVAAVPTAFALLALVHHRVPVSASALDGPCVSRSPEMLARAIAGDGQGAVECAVRRLRASGVPIACDAFRVTGDEIRRSAAALAFPLHPASIRRLRDGLRVEPEDAAVSSLSPAGDF